MNSRFVAAFPAGESEPERGLTSAENIVPETSVNRLQDESLGQCSSRHIAKPFLKAG